MKHTCLILLISSIALTGIFLPYFQGEYDYLAVGLALIFRLAAFASLLLIPVGLLWWLHPRYLMNSALVVTVIIILAAALGALANQSRIAATLVLFGGAFLFIKVLSNRKEQQYAVPARYHVLPYYFIFIPTIVFLVQYTFLEKAKSKSTAHAIKQSKLLIQDIETYHSTNGYYPLSLHSTIEDYHPDILGIRRFQYEPNGNAYNLYFEQYSDILGSQEIVMYNKRDEQEMTVHNQDLLRIASGNIIRGHHKVIQLPQPHWKIFYFD